MSTPTTNPSQETRLAPEPLTTCPKCTYALTGLPSAHRCPECGFEYDEYSWAWLAPEKKWRRSRILGWVLMILQIFAIAPQIFLRRGFILSSDLGFLQIILLIILLSALLFWIRWLCFIDERPIVVVTKMGVTFRGKHYGPYLRKFVRMIPWSEVFDVDKGSGLDLGGYWLFRKDGEKEILHHLFANQTEWKVLKKALLDAKAHYLSLDQVKDV